MNEQVAKISGASRVYAIVADPIQQVRTPQAMNAVFEEHDFDGVMVPFQVAGPALEDFFIGARIISSLDGMVITTPHKINASKLCDQLETSAQQVGSVNVIRREADNSLTGAVFDGAGFVTGLLGQSGSIAGKHIFQAGAGGAGRAVAFAALAENPASLTIYNRTEGKAQELAADLKKAFPDIRIEVSITATPNAETDLAINTTGLGMAAGDPLPFDIAQLPDHCCVADVIAAPEYTALLEQAKDRGLTAHSGKHMLMAQLGLITEFLRIAS